MLDIDGELNEGRQPGGVTFYGMTNRQVRTLFTEITLESDFFNLSP